MLKFWGDEVWAFDCEWVPDPVTGRRLYALGEAHADEEVVRVMYESAKGFDPESNPTPYLKPALCRVISIGVAVWRRRLPAVYTSVIMGAEREVIESFFQSVARARPMLVGYNSRQADLPILLQRGMASGALAPGFCKRPEKPWEGRDYFDRYSGWHVDLADVLGGYGSNMPKLSELCAAMGIPCKAQADGSQIAALWAAGDLDRIRRYQRDDALSTLALYLRAMYMAGEHPTGLFTLDLEESQHDPAWAAYLQQEVAA